jgi:peroxiredoxin
MRLLLCSLFLVAGFGLRAQDSLMIFRASVEAHPDSLSLHEHYINAMEKAGHLRAGNRDSVLGLLSKQYETWMVRFPHSATVPFAWGAALTGMENPKAKPYLLKAVSLNPSLGDAWEYLWEDAQRWGDFKGSLVYLKKAVDADPLNADYGFYYADSFIDDSTRYDAEIRAFVKKFPKNRRGAQALYWLAARTSNDAEKIAIYEQLRQQFPPATFDWSAAGMSIYFDFLLIKDPMAGLMLAREMKSALTDGSWDAKVSNASKVSAAVQALDAGRPADAVVLLRDVNLPVYSHAREGMDLLKAKVLAASGNNAGAYDSLLARYAWEPTSEVRPALIAYGSRIGKDTAGVDTDVAWVRNTAAKTAPSFKLYAYLNGDSTALSDYRGKVVLLTFWFPGCGPCRGEFPYFQSVIDKYKGQDVAYVGINVAADQDPYVLPFMKSSGYTFTPLRDDFDQVQKDYKVRVEPTNFLIDKNGRIVYSKFRIDDQKSQEMLETMIGTLLAKS